MGILGPCLGCWGLDLVFRGDLRGLGRFGGGSRGVRAGPLGEVYTTKAVPRRSGLAELVSISGLAKN